MSEITRRDALIAACRANREDDLPRLVFADYLDETGSETDAARATQIRRQCHAGPKQRYPDEATTGCYYDVDRGFIVAVESTAEWWLQHGDDLVREHDVQRVRLTTTPDTEVIGRYGANLTARFTAYRDRQTQIGMPFPNREGVTKALLEATWPSVAEWELPQPLLTAQATWGPVVIEPRGFVYAAVT